MLPIEHSAILLIIGLENQVRIGLFEGGRFTHVLRYLILEQRRTKVSTFFTVSITVDSEIFARILFSRIALKYILVM